MSYCAFCGAKLKEGAASCPVCGSAAEFRPDPAARESGSAASDLLFDADAFEPLTPERPAQPVVPEPEPVFGQTRRIPPQPPAPQRPVTQPPAPQRPIPTTGTERDRFAAEEPKPRQNGGRPARVPKPKPARPTAERTAADRNRRQPQQKESAGVREQAGAVLTRLRESEILEDAGGIAGAILKGSTPAARKVRSAIAIALGAALLLVILLAVHASTGERGVARKLAKAYSTRNADQVIALGSDLMRGLDTENGTYEQACRGLMEQLHSEFAAAVGDRYHVSYKVRVHDTIKGQTLKTRLIGSFGDAGAEAFDAGQVTELTAVSLNLRASHGGNSVHKRINLILIKENGKWRLASQLV